MYPRPSGPALTPDLARELDDAFFTSDPHGYFRGRNAVMLRPGPEASSEAESPLQERLVTLLDDLGRTVAVPTDRSYELQIAVDALAVRHHAAEALLRLTHVLLTPVPQSSGSTWAAVSLGPIGMLEVIAETTGLLEKDDDAYGTFRGLLIRDDLIEDEKYQHAAVVTYGEWFDFAMDLFRSTKPDINAAHNKFSTASVRDPWTTFSRGSAPQAPRTPGGRRRTERRRRGDGCPIQRPSLGQVRRGSQVRRSEATLGRRDPESIVERLSIEYGPGFGKNYGWADREVKRRLGTDAGVTWRNLVRIAELSESHLGHVKVAHHLVHADAVGVLHLINSDGTLTSGARLKGIPELAALTVTILIDTMSVLVATWRVHDRSQHAENVAALLDAFFGDLLV